MLRSDTEKDAILLQVMKIPRLDGGNGHKSVLWDTTCSNIFIRMGHADKLLLREEDVAHQAIGRGQEGDWWKII